MSKRDSGYERVKRDHYPTPHWVIDALAEVVPLDGKTIWEPACGSGKMAEAIRQQGGAVTATDIHRYRHSGMLHQFDFINGGKHPGRVRYDGIITNPPYGERGKLAEAFIESGLARIGGGGFLALLLPADFDHAKSRARFFADCPRFSGVITLTKRIKWFDRPTASGKMHGPKDNHCWFLWQGTLFGEHASPRVWYAPRQVVVQDDLAPPARGEAA
jgi:hypothetical protein